VPGDALYGSNVTNSFFSSALDVGHVGVGHFQPKRGSPKLSLSPRGHYIALGKRAPPLLLAIIFCALGGQTPLPSPISNLLAVAARRPVIAHALDEFGKVLGGSAPPCWKVACLWPRRWKRLAPRSPSPPRGAPIGEDPLREREKQPWRARWTKTMPKDEFFLLAMLGHVCRQNPLSSSSRFPRHVLRLLQSKPGAHKRRLRPRGIESGQGRQNGSLGFEDICSNVHQPGWRLES